MGILDQIVQEQARFSPSQRFQMGEDEAIKTQEASVRSIAQQQANKLNAMKLEQEQQGIAEYEAEAPARAEQKELEDLNRKTQLVETTYKLRGAEAALGRAKSMQLMPDEAQLTTVDVDGTKFDAVQLPGQEPMILGEENRNRAFLLRRELTKAKKKGSPGAKKITIGSIEEDMAEDALSEALASGKVQGVKTLDDLSDDELVYIPSRALMIARELASDEGASALTVDHIKKATEIALLTKDVKKKKNLLDKIGSLFGDDDEEPEEVKTEEPVPTRRWKEVK